jgi:4-amino-4-deoxy-L-arabinose transferase-like glycosyltransferase
MLNAFKKNKFELIVLLSILIVTASFRLYKIDQYMTFLGDEGRDALIVKRTLVNLDPPLIGPPTSVGNMYLGPLYYYMMSASMSLVWLNPVAAAVMVAIIGTLTVGLVYYLTRAWFNKTAAMVAAVLYSISPVNIIYSRSSWNPNPAPFFSLLGFLTFYKAHQTRNFRWLILTGSALAFAVQMHYLALILVPIYGILWLYELIIIFRKKAQEKYFLSGSLGGIVAFLILMSPLAIFDLKHNFINFRAISTFFLGDRATTVNLNFFNSISRLPSLYSEILIGHYISSEQQVLMYLVSFLVLVPVLYFLYQLIFKKKFIYNFFILTIWLLMGVAGLALYKQSIYDHYLGFLNPAPFLSLGSIAYLIMQSKQKAFKIVAGALYGVLMVVLIVINLQRSPLLIPPNNQLKRTQEVAKYLIAQSQNKPFNFALISAHNYDAAYQFYLDQYGHKPKDVPEVITDQLLVVCEDKECKPINNPKYEIAGFGWAKIEKEEEFKGVKIYKLIHNPAQE